MARLGMAWALGSPSSRRGWLLVASVAAAALYLALLAGGPLGLRLAAKPIPVLCMAAWVEPTSSYARRLRLGLLVSAVGDLLLEVPGDALFLAGMAAFLVAHVAFTAAFLNREGGLRLLSALPFAAWGVIVTSHLPHLGTFAGPVAVYTVAVSVMMWRSAAALGSGIGAPAAFVGAILFGLSDSLIAVDRFGQHVPGAGYPIILLYWAGQAGIARSAAPRGS